MGMSICGLIIQSLTRNRFVSPTTAGTMDGARLGVLVSMFVMGSANLFWRTFFVFAFTLLTTLKEQAEKVFGDFGMNLSTAFDIFASQVATGNTSFS